jgi:large subunit ribosomal protein L28
MAKCELCGKSVVFGASVSHSNRKTNRAWKPNIRKVKADINGTHKTVYVCSRCLRSGKLNRVQTEIKVKEVSTAPAAVEAVEEAVVIEPAVEAVSEAPAENA